MSLFFFYFKNIDSFHYPHIKNNPVPLVAFLNIHLEVDAESKNEIRRGIENRQGILKYDRINKYGI